MAKVQDRLQRFLELWRKYKAAFEDISEPVIEGLDTVKPAKFYSDLGIETDHAAKACLRDYSHLVTKRRRA